MRKMTVVDKDAVLNILVTMVRDNVRLMKTVTGQDTASVKMIVLIRTTFMCQTSPTTL